MPSTWVIRENSTVPTNAPEMEHNQPYSTEHGSVMEEMVQRYSHGHTLFATYSSAMYVLFDVATRGTKYHATIAPYKRGARKNGRGAYIAMNAQFFGPALWDKIYRDNINTLMTRTWNGNSSIDLEKYLSMHRHTSIQCQRCADHIQCVIPDERSRVGHFLENISGDHPNIMAAMAAICLDNTPNRMRNDFEKLSRTSSRCLIPQRKKVDVADANVSMEKSCKSLKTCQSPRARKLDADRLESNTAFTQEFNTRS